METALRALSVDYASIVRGLARPLDTACLGDALFSAFAARYEREQQNCCLLLFEQSGAHYLFDYASSVGGLQEDRTVAAWAVTPPRVQRRDVAYQRGFPLGPAPASPPVDRGHLIPHLSGGEFGPNIFRQDRALNRGWSEQGKRYRALEREAAATPGTFYFGHLLYEDNSAYPAEVETGLLRGGDLHVERFCNRPERG
jgi:hypothetical protein